MADHPVFEPERSHSGIQAGTEAPAHGAGPAAVVTAVPVLRGWLHALCFVASVPAGVTLVLGATSTRAKVSSGVYAVALSALFGVSGLYHRRRWSAAARRWMQRIDHATIFVMIAGSYTPLCVVALGGSLGTAILVFAWAGAAAGAALSIVDVSQKPVFGLVCYIALGWVMVLALPQLAHRVSTAGLLLIVVGGVIYTLGGIVLGTRWPDPVPSVFGYHELWHAMVAAAAVCHYLAIGSVVRGA